MALLTWIRTGRKMRLFAHPMIAGTFVLMFALGASFAQAPVLSAEVEGAIPLDSTPVLEEARKLATRGELLEAKERYKAFLANAVNNHLKAAAEKELQDLNFRILFSSLLTPDSVLYEVKPGDSLHNIAKDHRVTVELIVKSNQLKGFTIYPTQKLKVVTAAFSILIDRSDNLLYLRQGDEIIKTYKVATGENFSTPLGTFTIENKLVNPTWYHAGAVVPPHSPDNILGTRWLGFSMPGYGIHGTTMPETIGTASSAGCVRMRNEDVEELYAIVPLKARVSIVD